VKAPFARREMRINNIILCPCRLALRWQLAAKYSDLPVDVKVSVTVYLWLTPLTSVKPRVAVAHLATHCRALFVNQKAHSALASR